MICRVLLCSILIRATAVLAADDFDLYTNTVLGKVAASEGARPVQKISFSEIGNTKPVLSRDSGCFIVVRTDDGNWAKLVVRPSFRRHSDGEVPLVVIQRYHCFRPGTESGRLAAGKDVYLFDGMQFNLDVGQIVPDGGGGDIVFRREDMGGYLESTGKAKAFLITQPLVQAPASASVGPSAGPVIAEDFNGTFHLIASGKWSGQLRLKVTESNEVTGSYVSDQTGADYPVKGFVARPPHHIKFTIELPMAKQEFDGHLWTQGKNAIAGTMTLAGNSFGFVALRLGTDLVAKDSKE